MPLKQTEEFTARSACVRVCVCACVRVCLHVAWHQLQRRQQPELNTVPATPPSLPAPTPTPTSNHTHTDLLSHYLEHDQKLRKFVPLIQSSLVYPVIYDANRTVLRCVGWGGGGGLGEAGWASGSDEAREC